MPKQISVEEYKASKVKHQQPLRLSMLSSLDVLLSQQQGLSFDCVTRLKQRLCEFRSTPVNEPASDTYLSTLNFGFKALLPLSNNSP